MRRALRRIGTVGAFVCPLAFAGAGAAAPPKPAAPAAERPADAQPLSSTWVADELRILRADIESLRQRPDTSLAAEVATLRSEVQKLTTAQAELERRLGTASGGETQAIPIDHGGGGGGIGSALLFLALGAALGWVGGRLSQRWRDRRQRIRV